MSSQNKIKIKSEKIFTSQNKKWKDSNCKYSIWYYFHQPQESTKVGQAFFYLVSKFE